MIREKERLFCRGKERGLENVVLNGTMYFCYRCNCRNDKFHGTFFRSITLHRPNISFTFHFDTNVSRNATYKNLYTRIKFQLNFLFLYLNETNCPPPPLFIFVRISEKSALEIRRFLDFYVKQFALRVSRI